MKFYEIYHQFKKFSDEGFSERVKFQNKNCKDIGYELEKLDQGITVNIYEKGVKTQSIILKNKILPIQLTLMSIDFFVEDNDFEIVDDFIIMEVK